MLKNYTSGLITVIVGAIVSAILTFSFTYAPSKIEVGAIVRPSLIKLPDEFRKDLKIEYKSGTLSNLSMVEFSILNRGNFQGDIPSVELRFSFKPRDGQAMPALVSENLKGPPSLPDVGIEEVQRSNNLVVYKIQSLRETDVDHSYKAAFVFEGDYVPDWTVETSTQNVRVIDHRNYIDNFYLISLVSIGYAGIIVFVLVWTNRSDSRNRHKFLTKFKGALTAMPATTRFNNVDVDEIISTYEEITKPKPYGFRSWIQKKLSRNRHNALPSDAKPLDENVTSL